MKKRSKKRTMDEDDYKAYQQVGRVLDVLDRLKHGPLTTSQLADALDVSERTTIRFMGAMMKFGWPVLYQRESTEPTAQLEWAVDVDKLITRLDGRRIT